MITNPFEIGKDVFPSNTYSSATLCVPIGTKKKYEATAAWNLFQRIKEFVLPGDVNVDGVVDVADIATIIDIMAGKDVDTQRKILTPPALTQIIRTG